MKYWYNGWSSSRRRLTIMSLFLSIKYGSNKLLIREATHFVKHLALKSSAYSMYWLLSVKIARSIVPHLADGLSANRCFMCVFYLIATSILYVVNFFPNWHCLGIHIEIQHQFSNRACLHKELKCIPNQQCHNSLHLSKEAKRMRMSSMLKEVLLQRLRQEDMDQIWWLDHC